MTRLHYAIAILWLAFTLVFLGLAGCHWYASRSIVSPFRLKPRPWAANMNVQIIGSDIDQPLKDFAVDFNGYLDRQNAATQFQNRLSVAGYLAAAFTALVSFTLELMEGRKHNDDIHYAAEQEEHPI